MGGHAFGTLLGSKAVFPRMSGQTYKALKVYVVKLLNSSFSSVAVAREDPAKVDFGDLDVVVATESYLGGSPSVNIKNHIQELLRAERAVSNGSHFVSYAIAAATLDFHVPKRGVDGNSSTQQADVTPLVSDIGADVVVYHQVDVNLAKDADEMEAIPFYSSYGDLGMILSLVFKTVGMSYSKHGLKIVLPSYTHRIERPFQLTTSTAAVLSFLQLDYEIWKAGFSTRTEIYQWILNSRLANSVAILGVSPKHLERPMYQEFVRYTEQRATTDDEDHPPLDADQVVGEALAFFEKAEEYHELARSVELRKGLKLVLNGKIVQDITGLQGSIVGKIIAQVKEMAPPEELIGKSEAEVCRMIKEAQDRVQKPILV